MWITNDVVRLGKHDVEFREMIVAWGEALAIPDRVESAEHLVGEEIPRFVLDAAWEWAVAEGRQMSPVVAVSVRKGIR